MALFQWSTFSLKIYIKAPQQRVYDAWTKPAGLLNWFLRVADFSDPNGAPRDPGDYVRPGDVYNWKWHGYPDTLSEQGEVLEVNGTDHFKFRFGKAGMVTVQLREIKGLTEMVLVQDEIPTDEKSRADYHVGCSTGWTFYMANLKCLLEGGADLRNKDPELTNVINS